jgi:uncharacterized surface protein with fasciclin (FAS1) repeats
MNIRTIATALAVTTSTALAATAVPAPPALAATAVPAPPAHAAPTQRAGTTSLASVLAADGNHFDHNWRDFDIVDRAVTTVLRAEPGSDLAVLAHGGKRVTAFLPTDRAFRVLVEDLTGKRPARERAVFRAVAHRFDVDTLEAVLLYHVVPGVTITYAQARHADGAGLPTALEGASIRVRVVDDGVRLRDLDQDAPNARVLPGARNLNQGNRQIAHGVSRVLRPVNL